MESAGQYVVCVVAAALICGVISCFFENGTGKTLIRMLCGLFLTVTALSPIVKLDLSAVTAYGAQYSDAGANAASVGEKMAQEARLVLIKQQTEAYILDKAAQLNTDVTVEVTVGEEQAIVEAKFCGHISPYARMCLEEILESDLGITKENQIWTG